MLAKTDSDGLTCQVFKPCIAVPSAASYTSHPRLHTPIPLAALKPFDPPHASIHRCSSAPPRGCLCLCQQGVGRKHGLSANVGQQAHFLFLHECFSKHEVMCAISPSCPGCQVTSTNVLDLGGLHATVFSNASSRPIYSMHARPRWLCSFWSRNLCVLPFLPPPVPCSSS